MGQAKNRGTYEERKAKAEKLKAVREQIKDDMKQELDQKSTEELVGIAKRIGINGIGNINQLAVNAVLNRVIVNE